MADLFRKMLLEMSNSKESLISTINSKYENLISKGNKHSNFVFLLPNEIEVYDPYVPHCVANKCETNVFKFIKFEYDVHDKDYYYPVGGFGFVGESLHPVAHWWVYDKKLNKHLEITPIKGNGFRCYTGGINYDINPEIYESEKANDINFFKLGTPERLYFK